MNKNLFSKRLQDALNLSLLTPMQIANMTNISIENISSYLSGKLIPNSINLKKLADALKISDTWLKVMIFITIIIFHTILNICWIVIKLLLKKY